MVTCAQATGIKTAPSLAGVRGSENLCLFHSLLHSQWGGWSYNSQKGGRGENAQVSGCAATVARGGRLEG